MSDTEIQNNINKILDFYYGFKTCGFFIISLHVGHSCFYHESMHPNSIFKFFLTFGLHYQWVRKMKQSFRLCIGISYPLLAFSMTICKSFIFPKPLFLKSCTQKKYIVSSILVRFQVVYKDPFVPLMNAYTCILSPKVKFGFSLISERRFNCTNKTGPFFNGHTCKSQFI